MDTIARNNVQVLGQGERPLVFAHGFGSDQRCWHRLLPWFESDYRVVLFDYVGAGRSDLSAWSERRYSRLDGYTQDLLDVCRALDLERAVVVAHSISSMVALLATIREPRQFSHAVLVAPSPAYANRPPDFVGGYDLEDVHGLLEMMDRNFGDWARMLAPSVMGNPERPELATEFEDSLSGQDPAIARRFAEVAFLSDNRHLLESVTTPSLILQCTNDPLARPVVGDYLHARLVGSTLQTIEATGHFPHISAAADTAVAIRRYLEAQGLPGHG